MIGFVLNPPRRRRRKLARTHKTSKAAMRWKRAVAKFGVRGAAKRRRARRAAARKAHRAVLSKKLHVRRRVARKGVVPMARRKRSHRKARRVVRRRRHARRAHRRSRKLRRNPVEMNPRKHRRSRRKGARKAHRRIRRSRRMRRNSWSGQPIRHRRAARKAWRKHRRRMLPAVRRNVRKALNKKFGVRRWVKHSRAKWNPGLALSVSGVGKSITSVFNLENLYDGLAIGGGIIGALALPRIVDRFIPAGIKGRLPLGISLSTGWFSYIASAASAGLLGYLAGWAFGRRYGEKVFWGGIGATVAKLVLDYITPIKSFTGVGLSAYDSSLQRVIEQEVARELSAGGGMSAYVTPADVATATPLNEYATPEGALTAGSLGEFVEDEDFDA